MFFQKDLETMPRKQLEELQLERLKWVVDYCYRNVPFYQKRLDECGVTADKIKQLSDVQYIPFTTKEDIRDNYPFGLFAQPMKNIARIHASSGTPCKPTAKEVAAVKPDAARIALLRAALGSVADRAIIPMPDWLGLGAEAHLNTPGKLGGNWTWRAAEGFDAEPLASRIQTECEVYCRAKEPVEKEAKTSI